MFERTLRRIPLLAAIASTTLLASCGGPQCQCATAHVVATSESELAGARSGESAQNTEGTPQSTPRGSIRRSSSSAAEGPTAATSEPLTANPELPPLPNVSLTASDDYRTSTANLPIPPDTPAWCRRQSACEPNALCLETYRITGHVRRRLGDAFAGNDVRDALDDVAAAAEQLQSAADGGNCDAPMDALDQAEEAYIDRYEAWSERVWATLEERGDRLEWVYDCHNQGNTDVEWDRCDAEVQRAEAERDRIMELQDAVDGVYGVTTFDEDCFLCPDYLPL